MAENKVVFDASASVSSRELPAEEKKSPHLPLAPKTYIMKSKDVSISYVLTDYLRRLKEDIDELPPVKENAFSLFSLAIGVAPTALIGMLCDFDSTKISFRINLTALIISLVVAIICLFVKKRKKDDVRVSDKIFTIKRDLDYILRQAFSEDNHTDGSSMPGR